MPEGCGGDICVLSLLVLLLLLLVLLLARLMLLLELLLLLLNLLQRHCRIGRRHCHHRIIRRDGRRDIEVDVNIDDIRAHLIAAPWSGRCDLHRHRFRVWPSMSPRAIIRVIAHLDNIFILRPPAMSAIDLYILW
jgi:hypothetical protein